MSLDVDIALTRGALVLEVAFRCAGGETLALVGPNGAGKSTILSAVAGLVRAETGTIAFGGEILDGGEGGGSVDPGNRGVGFVFQDHRLFPGLDVLENVAFGPRARGVSRREAREEAMRWIERVGMGARARVRPNALSGGEAQRVALARALAARPRILLLDEPLAAVDASGRLAFRRLLREHLAAFTGPRLLVAHDVEDAVALADLIAVVEAGRIVQIGRVEDVVARPASRYASDLVGQNFYEGTCRAGAVDLGAMALSVATELEGDVALTIHPRAVSLFPEPPHGSPRNAWRSTVLAVESSLGRSRVRLGAPLPIVAEVTPAAIRELGLAPDREIWAVVKATEIVVTRR